MDHTSFLDALVSEGEAFGSAAAGNLDQPVPTCPGWLVSDLVAHLGGVYGWAAAAVAAGGERPRARPAPPHAPADLLGWFEDTRSNLVSELRRRQPDDVAWTFIPTGPQTVGWWTRRQALETAVHRFDAQLATGDADPIGEELAVEGVDEFLTYYLPRALAQSPVEGLHGSLHLHATDAAGEWWLDLDSSELATRREHAKADTALRGPASGLYLWLWNRQSPDQAHLEVFGDPSIEESWRLVKG